MSYYNFTPEQKDSGTYRRKNLSGRENPEKRKPNFPASANIQFSPESLLIPGSHISADAACFIPAGPLPERLLLMRL
ncbi:MAG: hypothetical protein B6D37_13005 [Sphingobacteriales bacterium UTBCD1]|nr:MAG: hypothetical protein B6D37_13005 [Sphingobacteriales bacterium UTBCD1]